MTTSFQELQLRLQLSADEIREALPNAPDWFVEDYLNIFNDANRIAEGLDATNGEVGDFEQLRNDVSDLQTRVAALEQKAMDFDQVLASINRPTSRANRFKFNKATISQVNQGGGVVNTNTPSGTTAYAQPFYDESGTLLGYAPIYGSQW